MDCKICNRHFLPIVQLLSRCCTEDVTATGSSFSFSCRKFHLTLLFHVIFLLQQVFHDYVFLCFVSEKSMVRISVGVILPVLIYYNGRFFATGLLCEVITFEPEETQNSFLSFPAEWFPWHCFSVFSVFFSGAIIQNTYTRAQTWWSTHTYSSEWTRDCDRKVGTTAFYGHIRFFVNVTFCPEQMVNAAMRLTENVAGVAPEKNQKYLVL